MIFGIVPFAEMSGAAIAALVAIYFLAYFIRGMLGFGSATPAVLFGAWLLPPHDAILLALVTSVYAQVQLLPQGFRHGDLAIVKPLIAGSVVSIVIGVWIFATLEAAWLTIALGLLLGVSVAGEMAGVAERVGGRLDLRRFSVPFALATFGGLMGAIAGAGGIYVISVYLRWAAPRPVVFRATNILFSAFSNLWRGAVALAGGLISSALAIEAALLMPVILLGGWSGGKLSARLTAKRYFRVYRMLLLAAAVSLIWKGLGALA